MGNWWDGNNGTVVFCANCGYELREKIRAHPQFETSRHYWDPAAVPGKQISFCPKCNLYLGKDTTAAEPVTVVWGANRLVRCKCGTAVLIRVDRYEKPMGGDFYRDSGTGEQISYCPGCHRRLTRIHVDYSGSVASSQQVAPAPAHKNEQGAVSIFDLLLALLASMSAESNGPQDDLVRKAYGKHKVSKERKPDHDNGPTPDPDVWGDFVNGLDMGSN